MHPPHDHLLCSNRYGTWYYLPNVFSDKSCFSDSIRKTVTYRHGLHVVTSPMFFQEHEQTSQPKSRITNQLFSVKKVTELLTKKAIKIVTLIRCPAPGWVGSSIVHLGDHNVPNVTLDGVFCEMPDIFVVSWVLDDLKKYWHINKFNLR